jgi:hypothetical protein
MGVKWMGREADYSPAYRAQVNEVKDVWSYTSTPYAYAFMACTGTALEIITGMMKRKERVKKQTG